MQDAEQRYMDACDDQLIHALAQRFCSCQMMSKYTYTPESWTVTKKKLKKLAEKHNIPYEMVEKVYRPIIEISKELMDQGDC